VHASFEDCFKRALGCIWSILDFYKIAREIISECDVERKLHSLGFLRIVRAHVRGVQLWDVRNLDSIKRTMMFKSMGL
jgi:hypothetical protein